MKKTVWLILLAVCATGLLIFSFCNRCCSSSGDGLATDSDTVATVLQPDTTIYGESLEYGMSTFSLRTDAGDTLLLDRNGNGRDGQLYGNLDHEGDRFALTVLGADSDMPSVGTAINLSDLSHFDISWAIHNGRLLIGPDTVNILSLSSQCLVVEMPDHQQRTYLPSK